MCFPITKTVTGDSETILKLQKSAPYNETSLWSLSEAPKFYHRRDSHWSLSLWLIPETAHKTAFDKVLNKHFVHKHIWMLLLTFWILLASFRASLVAQMVKNLPAMQENWGQSLGWEDPLEKGIATHSSIPARRIPWTEEPGGLQSMGSQRIRHNREQLSLHFTSLPHLSLTTTWSQQYSCPTQAKVSNINDNHLKALQ